MKKIPLVLLVWLVVLKVNSQPDMQVNPADTVIAEGNYALIAGGSKGIGYAIAEALARRHYNLILIARHVDSLQAAKKKLETAYAIDVKLLANDLSREAAADEISQWCIARKIPLTVLCN